VLSVKKTSCSFLGIDPGVFIAMGSRMGFVNTGWDLLCLGFGRLVRSLARWMDGVFEVLLHGSLGVMIVLSLWVGCSA